MEMLRCTRVRRDDVIAQGEKIVARMVFERDGYVCHICGLPTDPTKRRYHPMAPELDHVQPISRGGLHTLDNVACSHSMCNLAKGGKLRLPESRINELRNIVATHASLKVRPV